MVEKVIDPGWEVIAVILLNRLNVPSNGSLNKYVFAYQLVCCELWSRRLLFAVCEGVVGNSSVIIGRRINGC